MAYLHPNLNRSSNCKDCASRISQWISCAVSKGVEKINLDLSEWCSFRVDLASTTAYEQYVFPCLLLASSGKGSTIKHLQLASCNFCSIPCSNNLNTLVTVALRGVQIIDEQMESFLLACSSLERLSLDNCKYLVNLKFAVPDLRLKFLSIRNCLKLESIGICAEDLLMVDYTGQFVRFSFINVPKLAQVFLNFTTNRSDGVDYALSRLAYDLPKLETLNLVSVLSLMTLKLPENVPMFTNIKQLQLTVFPFHDEDKLYWASYILKAFPYLQKLQLNLFTPDFYKQSKGVRYLSECPHAHLSELEINGFYGNPHEVELLSYLLNNLCGLKILVISPCKKLYKGFDNWVYEEASSWYKLSPASFRWLYSTVPPTVHLQIL